MSVTKYVDFIAVLSAFEELYCNCNEPGLLDYAGNADFALIVSTILPTEVKFREFSDKHIDPMQNNVFIKTLNATDYSYWINYPLPWDVEYIAITGRYNNVLLSVIDVVYRIEFNKRALAYDCDIFYRQMILGEENEIIHL